MQDRLGVLGPEEKFHRVLHAVLDKQLYFDDVFIAGKHECFLWDWTGASACAPAGGRLCGRAKANLDTAHLRNIYDFVTLHGPRQMVPQPRFRLIDLRPEQEYYPSFPGP